MFKRKKELPRFGPASGCECSREGDSRMPTLQSWVCQSVGKARSHNEDAVLSLQGVVSGPGNQRAFGLYIIADGMGGHLDGEVASNLATQTAARRVWNALMEPYWEGKPALSDEQVEALLAEAMQAAQEAVLNQVSGGGTTLTMAALLDTKLFFAHVGDSRLYLWDGSDGLKLLTRDHSLVRRLVELGQISPEEANHHPQRNVLFRAMGQVEGFRADIGQQELESPATLLLCSDGLWSLVEDSQMVALLESELKSGKSAQALVEAANNAGGTDNISAIVITLT